MTEWSRWCCHSKWSWFVCEERKFYCRYDGRLSDTWSQRNKGSFCKKLRRVHTEKGPENPIPIRSQNKNDYHKVNCVKLQSGKSLVLTGGSGAGVGHTEVSTWSSQEEPSVTAHTEARLNTTLKPEYLYALRSTLMPKLGCEPVNTMRTNVFEVNSERRTKREKSTTLFVVSSKKRNKSIETKKHKT